MKKIIFLLFSFIMGAGMISCSEDKISDESIFVDTDETWNDFDSWLELNYLLPYNIDFRYKMSDIESDKDYNLVPAQYEKTIQMAKLVKHLFLDVYNEIAGINFTRSYVPKVYHCIGSPAYNPSNGTMVLASAESGLKITLYNINALNPHDIVSLNRYYFNTIHHEFFHIMHQTIDLPEDFKTISAVNYLSPSSWNNASDAVASSLGFVSAYSRASYNEDFVETMSRYITSSDAQWTAWLALGSNQGTATINKKLQICREYLTKNWKIDLDKLRIIVQRRQGELDLIDFDNL